MPIIHYPGYITKEQAAIYFKVQQRTINDWIRKANTVPSNFSYLKIDGHICIKDPSNILQPPPGIILNTLETVHDFAQRHKMNFERVYEDIIKGKISGVILAERIFVINTEPQLADYIAKYKRLKKEPSHS